MAPEMHQQQTEHPRSPTRTRGGRARPRILMITPELPYRTIPHAGGQYVWRLLETLQGMADVVVVSHATPSNDKAVGDPGDLPINTIITRPKTPAAGRVHHFARRLQDLVHRLDPSCPDLPFLVDLISDRELRSLIRGADIIDLQWSEYNRLWPVLRILNPQARLIGTSHDVLFQRLSRVAETQSRPLRRARWQFAAWISRRWEIVGSRHLDTTIVFSEKDRTLLREAAGSAASITVVNPPLGMTTFGPRKPGQIPTATVIGFFARQENVDAVKWLLSEVWPSVRSACPQARLRLVGSDPYQELNRLGASAEGVSVVGFVEDLGEEYAQTTLTLVPVQSGAGVKFKTIESLLAGTPVVATTVGAEGIGTDEILTAVTDDATDFASAVIEVLRDPTRAEEKAEVSRRWAERVYGKENFRHLIRAIYVQSGNSVQPGPRRRSARRGLHTTLTSHPPTHHLLQPTSPPTPSPKVVRKQALTYSHTPEETTMRIGFLSPWRTDDPSAWSGTILPMYEALSQRADVTPLWSGDISDAAIDRAYLRVVGQRLGTYLPGHAIATAMKHGRTMSKRLASSKVDVVLAVAGSQDVSFLSGRVPVVQVSDTTFVAIQELYPLYSHLSPLLVPQGIVQARRSVAKVQGTLAATAWAKEALIRDDGIPAAQITVAPFGPAIGATMRTRTRKLAPMAPRILLVASDWERKGGPDALAAFEILRRTVPGATMTIVGQAPRVIPGGVRSLGRVTSKAMGALYDSHDILLELARGNASGITLTDAASHGLPVIATNVGGVSTIVAQRSSGILLEPGPDLSKRAAQEMEVLCTTPSVWDELSQGGLKRSESLLNWARWADTALDLIQYVQSHPRKALDR